jgi:hypothetical protein
MPRQPDWLLLALTHHGAFDVELCILTACGTAVRLELELQPTSTSATSTTDATKASEKEKKKRTKKKKKRTLQYMSKSITACA